MTSSWANHYLTQCWLKELTVSNTSQVRFIQISWWKEMYWELSVMFPGCQSFVYHFLDMKALIIVSGLCYIVLRSMVCFILNQFQNVTVSMMKYFIGNHKFTASHYINCNNACINLESQGYRPTWLKECEFLSLCNQFLSQNAYITLSPRD